MVSHKTPRVSRAVHLHANPATRRSVAWVYKGIIMIGERERVECDWSRLPIVCSDNRDTKLFILTRSLFSDSSKTSPRIPGRFSPRLVYGLSPSYDSVFRFVMVGTVGRECTRSCRLGHVFLTSPLCPLVLLHLLRQHPLFPPVPFFLPSLPFLRPSLYLLSESIEDEGIGGTLLRQTRIRKRQA